MRITDDQIVAPDLPQDIAWINRDPAKIDDLLRTGPVLVEFWDFTRVNSLRTLPYMEEWHRRYGALGASIIGIHTPGYTIGGDDAVVRFAVDRLGLQRPVILDPGFVIWRDYGNRGWPARYLWSAGGWLRYWHYGEGDYADCETALQESLREHGFAGELPPVMDPVRPEDTPGIELPAQTADIALPGDSQRLRLAGRWKEGADWLEALEANSTLTASCDAGAAFVVVSGRPVAEPGIREIAIDKSRATYAAAEPGIRVHGFQFTPRT